MDGKPDPIARRRRAFRRWLFAYPVATLAFVIYAMATSARTDMGEFLLLMVAVAIAALTIPLLALIDGARVGAIGSAIGGCLVGIAPAVLMFAGILEGERAYYDHIKQTQRKRVAELVDASARGDRDGVRAAMARLPAEYGPGRALCIVGAGSRGEYGERNDSDDWLLPEPDGGVPRVSAARLFDTAEALMQGRPRAQQQDVLAALLVRLSERQEALGFLPGWLRLWRGTQAEPTTRALAFATPRDPNRFDYCHLEGDADLARIVADSWHDGGLAAWVRAGYGFSPEQGPAALNGLRSKAGLDALTADGFDVGAALRRAEDREVMYGFAAQAPLQLDQSATPAALADLLDAYLRAGAELGRTTYGKTLCETFLDNERMQAKVRTAAPTPARDAAAQRIREALCPGGKPPARTSSTTTAHEDELSATVEAAIEEGRRQATELQPAQPAQ
ncbi:hypothetical protein ACI2IY_17360 [Lysobacter enzymogenes]|uniref:hypothetical protein n=1 Tax=Lysobacter enzymogenes TaxID=69 RepID=UPI00384A6A9B